MALGPLIRLFFRFFFKYNYHALFKIFSSTDTEVSMDLNHLNDSSRRRNDYSKGVRFTTDLWAPPLSGNRSHHQYKQQTAVQRAHGGKEGSRRRALAFNVGTQLKTHIHLQATQELSGDWKTCFLISFASNC